VQFLKLDALEAPSAQRTQADNWLKLETHLHTVHSDGQDDVATMFEACRAAGYDAVALTDHNTLSGLPEARDVAAELGLILIEGVEVTTFHGHLIALGATELPEWRDVEQRGISELAREVRAQGGLVCVAHPARLGSPVCSGCAWEWAIEPELVDLWEVFSAPQPAFPHPDISLRLWRKHLADGGRAAPVAAGDVHSARAAGASRAATYVTVDEPTPLGILDALRAGRVCASRARPIDVAMTNGRPSAPGATIEKVGEGCSYAELRDADGALEAVSAPIWTQTSHLGETSV
jgi:hypothetical protein